MCRRVLAFLSVFLVAAGAARAAKFSDQAVQNAVKRGVAYLLKAQQANGSWGDKGEHGNQTGRTALATYALLESGMDPQNDRIKKALYWVGRCPNEIGTYSLGLRCVMWEAANRRANGRYRKVLHHDAKQLWQTTVTGSYDYHSKGLTRVGRWDNSNSQYGLLGVWAADMAHIEVPQSYWARVAKHWESCQNGDGGWGYQKGESAAGMVAGGVASLYVAYDHVYRDHFVTCGRRGYGPVKKGIGWIDKNFTQTLAGQQLGHSDMYYYLYGVERVGLASGYKHFGKVDWYKRGAEYLISHQSGDGSWTGKWGGEVGTAYSLLFLVRGRNAILFNKLQFDGDWNNRPRDMANLAGWLSRQFERTLNWQIVGLAAPVSEWDDAPIIYISGSRLPKFTDEQVAKLRAYVLQGGSIVSVTECGGVAGFKKGIRDLYARMFPKYKLSLIPPNHEIYSRKVYFDLAGAGGGVSASGEKIRILPNGVIVRTKVTGTVRTGKGPKPTLYMLSNGVRALAIHTDEDISLRWQLKQTVSQKWAFWAGTNIVRYLTGTIDHVRPRGTRNWPKPHTGGARTAKIVRLKHEGNYDPEPLAYERFARLMAARAGTSVEVAGPIDIKDLPASGAKLATLTGTDELELSQTEMAALRDFVKGGGLVMIDAAGGSKAFADSAEATIRKVFGPGSLRTLAASASLYRMPGQAIPKVKYRRRTQMRMMRRTAPNIKAVLVGKRVGVLFSREDITAGLVGYPSFAVDGYDPETAYQIMRNVVLSVH